MTLDDLIRDTEAEAGAGAAPLDRLTCAARRQQELADLGDQLLDHFVQQARTAGCSWSQVGDALGVSKQAAQQRHSGPRGLIGALRSKVRASGMFARFVPEARTAVVQAQEEARQLRHNRVGTEHVLLGLLAGEGGAAGVLAEHGLGLDQARTAVVDLIGRGQRMPTGHIPFSPRSKKALERSLREAVRMRHNWIGPEHVLLGLLGDPDAVAVAVLDRCGVPTGQVVEAATERLARGDSRH